MREYGSRGLFNTGQCLYCIMLNSTYVSCADIVDPNSQVHANTITIKTYIDIYSLLLLLLLILDRRLVSDTSVVLKRFIRPKNLEG